MLPEGNAEEKEAIEGEEGGEEGEREGNNIRRDGGEHEKGKKRTTLKQVKAKRAARTTINLDGYP